MAEIERVVRSRTDWIRKTRERYKDYAAPLVHTYETGDLFYLHGTPRKLIITEGGHPSVTVSDSTITVQTRTGTVYADESQRKAYYRRKLVQWYKAEAKQELTERVAYWCSRYPELDVGVGEASGEITLRLMKRRWGSCDKQGRLTFNTTLICAPPELIDYVIVHELCHRVEFNHGKAFYQNVEQYLPGHQRLHVAMRLQAGLWVL